MARNELRNMAQSDNTSSDNIENAKTKTMSLEEAELIFNNWNGEDYRFMVEGEIYTEDDVCEAEEVINEYNKSKPK